LAACQASLTHLPLSDIKLVNADEPIHPVIHLQQLPKLQHLKLFFNNKFC
jgi:hypothetical protein